MNSITLDIHPCEGFPETISLDGKGYPGCWYIGEFFRNQESNVYVGIANMDGRLCTVEVRLTLMSNPLLWEGDNS